MICSQSITSVDAAIQTDSTEISVQTISIKKEASPTGQLMLEVIGNVGSEDEIKKQITEIDEKPEISLLSPGTSSVAPASERPSSAKLTSPAALSPSQQYTEEQVRIFKKTKKAFSTVSQKVK